MLVVGRDLGTTVSSIMLIAAINWYSNQIGSTAVVAYAHLVRCRTEYSENDERIEPARCLKLKYAPLRKL